MDDFGLIAEYEKQIDEQIESCKDSIASQEKLQSPDDNSLCMILIDLKDILSILINSQTLDIFLSEIKFCFQRVKVLCCGQRFYKENACNKLKELEEKYKEYF